MEIKKAKLETIKNALQYGMLFSNDEAETAEFALLLNEVQVGIIQDAGQEVLIKEIYSLHGCPFHYCDSNPKCKDKCRYA